MALQKTEYGWLPVHDFGDMVVVGRVALGLERDASPERLPTIGSAKEIGALPVRSQLEDSDHQAPASAA